MLITNNNTHSELLSHHTIPVAHSLFAKGLNRIFKNLNE